MQFYGDFFVAFFAQACHADKNNARTLALDFILSKPHCTSTGTRFPGLVSLHGFCSGCSFNTLAIPDQGENGTAAICTVSILYGNCPKRVMPITLLCLVSFYLHYVESILGFHSASVFYFSFIWKLHTDIIGVHLQFLFGTFLEYLTKLLCTAFSLSNFLFSRTVGIPPDLNLSIVLQTASLDLYLLCCARSVLLMGHFSGFLSN